MPDNRIFHNFARPKKLLAVKSTIIAHHNVTIKQKNDCRILLKRPCKKSEIIPQKPIESFTSKYMLQKKNYFHEPYLENLAEKYSKV